MNTVQSVKREQQQPQKEDEKSEKKEDDLEPHDTVDIGSAVVPEIEYQADGQDQFWITVEAATDLLEQHQHIYPALEYQQLQGHIVHLRTEKIEKLYWPPSLTFAAALIAAATADNKPDEPSAL